MKNIQKILQLEKNTDRAILLTGDKISMREKEGTKIWHIIPGAGKQGKPVVVIKKAKLVKNIILIQIQRLFYAYHIFCL